MLRYSAVGSYTEKTEFFLPQKRMSWATSKTFNADYQQYLDDYLWDLENECYEYDSRLGVYNPPEGYMSLYVKRADVYQVPPLLIELYTSTPMIVKRYARTIIFYPELRCLPLNIRVDFRINCLDWLTIIADTWNKIFYVNCNPQSEHYGKVLLGDHKEEPEISRIVYPNIAQLVHAITTWMYAIIDVSIPVFDVEAFMNSECTWFRDTYTTNRVTRRELLEYTGDDPNYTLWKVITELRMIENQQYAESTARSFTDYVLHTCFARTKK